MIAELKAEIRKLITIRSTYLIVGFTALLLLFLAFVFRNSHDPNNHHVLANSIYDVSSTVSLFAAIVGVLLMAHEYRYNTIIHTLSASNSRTKVLVAKIVTMLAFSLVFTLIVNVVSLGSLSIFANLWGVALPSQEINLLEHLIKSFFYISSYALIGLLFAALFRNLVASMVSLFLIPALIELPANLLLKHNSVYMPFSALEQVILTPSAKAQQAEGPFVLGSLSPGKAALLFLAYLAVGWFAAWMLFLRRDAT